MKRALRLVAPLALLLALSVMPPAPAAPAPGVCADACFIDGNSFAYLPPVMLVQSGASVTWRSADTAHVTDEGTGFGGGTGCFTVSHAPTADSESVAFVSTHDGLMAYTDGKAGPERCAHAVDLQDGRYALPYYCILHGTMRGVLVVVPADA